MAVGGVSGTRYDNVRLGGWLGFLLPAVVFGGSAGYIAWLKGAEYLWHYLSTPSTAARMLCLATLSNAVTFFIALYGNRLRTARGVLALTIIWALVVFVLALVR